MMLVAATRKGLFRFDRNGATADSWSIVGRDFLGEPVTAVVVDPARRYWLAALRLGHFGVKLHASDDACASWREIDAPAYPPKPQDSDDPVPWALDQVWVLEGLHAAAPQRIWAGTLPGGLFRSEDRGSSWQLVESLWNRPERRQWFGGGDDHPGIHSICVDPARSATTCSSACRAAACGAATTAARPGTLPRTACAPSTCRPSSAEAMPTSRTRTASCSAGATRTRSGPSTTTASSATDDGGDALDRDRPTSRPSVFGFAVAVHPRDPETAWFVPAVKDEQPHPGRRPWWSSRTRDGGRTLRGAARRPAAGARLRPGLSPRPGRRRRRRDGWRSARRPARCGSQATRETPGPRYPRRCRRSTRCVLSELSTGPERNSDAEIDPTRRPPRIGLCPAAGGAPFPRAMPGRGTAPADCSSLGEGRSACKAAGWRAEGSRGVRFISSLPAGSRSPHLPGVFCCRIHLLAVRSHQTGKHPSMKYASLEAFLGHVA